MVNTRKRPAPRLNDKELAALEQQYLGQLPMIAALLVADGDYEPEDIADEALDLITACLGALGKEG